MFRSLLPASVLFAVLVAACSGAAATPVPTTAPVTVAPTTAPVSAAPSVAAGPTVSVSSAGFFVGPNGMTLYSFDKDSAGKSNCQSGQCLANWPALMLPSGTQISVGSGLTAADFATITRNDGSAQVTFKQVPLYFFAGDAKPGDKNGDGVGGIWHLATTSTVPPAPSSAPSAAATAAAGPTVSLSSAGFFVGPNGMTLYAFDKDTAGTSNCQTGQCVANWPALVLPTGTQMSVGTGLTATDFATITRTDGTAQVTFKQVPLYYFAGDAKPGDKNGDGVGGIWHVATASTVPPAASSAPSAAASPGTSKVCYDAYHYVIPCP